MLLALAARARVRFLAAIKMVFDRHELNDANFKFQSNAGHGQMSLSSRSNPLNLLKDCYVEHEGACLAETSEVTAGLLRPG